MRTYELLENAPPHVSQMIDALHGFWSPQSDDGLPGDDGRPAGGTAPRPADGQTTCIATRRRAIIWKIVLDTIFGPLNLRSHKSIGSEVTLIVM